MLTSLLLAALPLCAQPGLRIRILEGEGDTYALGSRATRGITVQVTAETGEPVSEAAVTFRLPDSGPGGTFASGGRTEVIVTGPDGRVTVWGMQWNRVPGPFEVRITAAKGEARAGTVCPLALIDAPQTGLEPSRGHKKLWIALAGVGAAVAAVAAASSGSSPGAAPPPAVNAPRIGAPTITIGRP
jgi:hypothetical protein